MSFQLSPITCCACQCDPSVIIQINGGGGGGGGSGILYGTDNPNDAGLIPSDPSKMIDYRQLYADGSGILTAWTWNPNTQLWV